MLRSVVHETAMAPLASPRVLLVEDDRMLAASLAMGLRDDGFDTSVVHTYADGFQAAITKPADLIILDVVLQDRSGIELAEALRNQGIAVPILMLTARADTATMLLGLAWADDYVVKPVALEVLAARLGALQRRWSRSSDVRRVGDLVLDFSRLLVRRGDTEEEVTPAQAKVLGALMANAGSVMSREQICIWLENDAPCSNVIDVHVRALRAKIDDPFDSTWIQTVRGVGYRLNSAPRPR